MNPLRKDKNKEMPLRFKGSKSHKEMINHYLKFVNLCVFEPLWQNYT